MTRHTYKHRIARFLFFFFFARASYINNVHQHYDGKFSAENYKHGNTSIGSSSPKCNYQLLMLPASSRYNSVMHLYVMLYRSRLMQLSWQISRWHVLDFFACNYTYECVCVYVLARYICIYAHTLLLFCSLKRDVNKMGGHYKYSCN